MIDKPNNSPLSSTKYGKKDTVVFCLDGTLSDFRHRIDLRMNDYNWDNFHEASDKDPVIVDAFELLQGLISNFCIVVYSTRPERYRQMTVDWLRTHSIYPDLLLLKPHHLNGKDDKTKVTMLLEEFGGEELNTENAIQSIVAIFENDKTAATTLRNAGFSVFSGS